MTRFKIIHNTANKKLVQGGPTHIDKIFCTEFNEEPKTFDIVYDRESYPYPELMETICEKISEYLKQNYVYSIYECSSGKNVKGFRIYVDAKKKDGFLFDENDLIYLCFIQKILEKNGVFIILYIITNFVHKVFFSSEHYFGTHKNISSNTKS